jgi:DnaJ-class molecular chaperone
MTECVRCGGTGQNAGIETCHACLGSGYAPLTIREQALVVCAAKNLWSAGQKLMNHTQYNDHVAQFRSALVRMELVMETK